MSKILKAKRDELAKQFEQQGTELLKHREKEKTLLANYNATAGAIQILDQLLTPAKAPKSNG